MTSVASSTAGEWRGREDPRATSVAAPGHPPTLDAAYAECERIARASSSSFTLAFHLLPHDRRRALAALYAYCRIVDDAADEGRDARATLAVWRARRATLALTSTTISSTASGVPR